MSGARSRKGRGRHGDGDHLHRSADGADIVHGAGLRTGRRRVRVVPFDGLMRDGTVVLPDQEARRTEQLFRMYVPGRNGEL
ncbi:MAG: hypothetical protein WDN69_02760 [Aliidongia sp.]